MKIISPVCLAVYIFVTAMLAVTTFLSPTIYGTWWFVGAWTLFAAVLIAAIVKTHMWHRAGRFILHISLLAMLGGGLMTWLTQTRGRVRIEPGQTADQFIDEKGSTLPLPTPLKLENFEIDYYPGGEVPRDYISHLTVDGTPMTVSMNNILTLNGYRILQYSYDDHGASVLSVNHDPYGIFLSYAGYALFALGGIILLLDPRGRFRTLLKKSVIIFILAISSTGNLSADTIEGVPLSSADSLRSQQVLYNGKIVTFNTLSRDVLLKLYGKPSYRGLSAEQTLLSIKLFPEKWKDQPLILIKEKTVSKALGIDGKYARLSDLFDETGRYRVQSLYFTLEEDNRRAVEDLDEKAGIILTLLSGDLIVSRPEEVPALSDTRVDAELLYNSLPFTKIIFILLFSGFFTGMALHMAMRHKGHQKRSLTLKIITNLPRAMLACATLVSAICFGFQWYLSARFPLANTFETLLFVVLMMELILLISSRKNILLMSMGMLMTGALALVAHLVATNPVVTQLMPVLHSGWLSLHVTLVMTSYAILGFTFIVAFYGIAVPSSAKSMRSLATCLLYPGVYLLGLGIFSGAVWANVSWGQYWSWDPKETWALITMLVYALPLHTSIKFFRSTRVFLVYIMIAIISIAMTYFGVNYMDSMHAYN